MKFGPQCVGELVRYKWKKTRKNEIQCTNEPNTCERALCECDNKYTSEVFHRARFSVSVKYFRSRLQEMYLMINTTCSGETGTTPTPTTASERLEFPSQSAAEPMTGQCKSKKYCLDQASSSRGWLIATRRVLFNSLNKECCLDKTVKPIGMCETF